MKIQAPIFLLVLYFTQIDTTVTENISTVRIDIGLLSVQKSTSHVYKYWTEIFHQIQTIYNSVQSLHVEFRVTSFQTIDQPPNDQIQTVIDEDGFDEEYTRKLLQSKPGIMNIDISIIHYNTSSTFEGIYYHSSSEKCTNSGPTIGGIVFLSTSPKKFVLNLAWALGKIIKSLDYNNKKSEWQDINEDALFYNSRSGRLRLISSLDQNFLNITFSQTDDCFSSFPQLSGPPPFDFEFDMGFEGTTVEPECKDLVGENTPLPHISNTMCGDINCASVNFDRFDGSNCGKGGRCLDGICMDPGKLLVNVATGRCLMPNGRFKAHDKPILIDCPSTSSFTQRWTLVATNSSGKILKALFTY